MGKKKLKRMAEKMGLLRQVAALPYRVRENTVEFLVITSRRHKRLIVPRGWPIAGLTDAQAAATEADEVAGVKGRIEQEPFASFLTISRRSATSSYRSTRRSFRFASRRSSPITRSGDSASEWMSAEEASERLDDSGLKQLVRRYAERLGSSE